MLLIEEAVCPDIFVSGVGKVEKLSGGLVRVIFYVERQTDSGKSERVVVAKIVRTLASIVEATALYRQAIAEADAIFIAESGKPMN